MLDPTISSEIPDQQDSTSPATATPPQVLTIPRDLDPQSQSNLKYWIAKLFSGSTSTSINGRSHNQTLSEILPGSGGVPKYLDFQTNDFANGITWGTTISGHPGFTVVTAGQYLVTLTIRYNVTDNTGYFGIIYKNGISVSTAEVYVNGGETSVVVTDILDCSVGDYIDFYAQTSGNLDSTLFNGSDQTYCSIAKV